MKARILLVASLLLGKLISETLRLFKTFTVKMAPKNVCAIKAALNDCATVEEWETLTGCIEIPEELFSDVYSRLIDLSWQDIDVEVS